MSAPQLYSLSWGEQNSALISTARNLHRLGDLVDVTLSAEGKMFPAHKLVLSAASPMLMELLKSTKCEHPVVMLAGISAVDLEAILHLIYHGQVSVETDSLASLIQAAQCLDIQALTPLLSASPPKFPTTPLFDLHNTIDHQADALNIHGSKKKHRSKGKPLLIEKDQSEDGSSSPARPSPIENHTPASEDGNEMKKPTLSSDMPVSCPVCHTIIRQSRNLRRHMELIHLRTEGTARPPKKKSKKNESASSTGSPSPSVSMRDNNDDMTHDSLILAAMASRLVNSSLDEEQGPSQPNDSPEESSYSLSHSTQEEVNRKARQMDQALRVPHPLVSAAGQLLDQVLPSSNPPLSESALHSLYSSLAPPLFQPFGVHTQPQPFRQGSLYDGKNNS